MIGLGEILVLLVVLGLVVGVPLAVVLFVLGKAKRGTPDRDG